MARRKSNSRVTNLNKLPKGLVTVDDVICCGNVSKLLDEVQGRRADISTLLITWQNLDGSISYRYVCGKGDSMIDIVAMCEIVKQHCIKSGWENENEVG